MHIFLCLVFGQSFEHFFELRFEISERVRDWNFEKFDSEIAGERASIVDAAARRVRAGHGNTGYILRSQRIHRDHGSDRRIDSTAQADHRGMEVAFAEIIANSQ